MAQRVRLCNKKDLFGTNHEDLPLAGGGFAKKRSTLGSSSKKPKVVSPETEFVPVDGVLARACPLPRARAVLLWWQGCKDFLG